MNPKLAPPESCANCGARVLPGAARCEYCHQPIVWQRTPPRPTRGSTPKGNLVVALMVAGAGMLAVAAVGLGVANALKSSGQPATSSVASSPPTHVADVEPRPPPPPPTVQASPEADANLGRGQGQLPREVIQRIMRTGSGAFRLCYQRGLASNPKLEGRVNVHFVIGPNGSVTEVTTPGSTLKDENVLRCISARVAAMTFPSPGGDTVSVTYPFIFQAR
jgi:hypothetical protein